MYGCTIWSNARIELLDDLLILQKRAARLILDKDPRAHSIELFRQLEWIPVHNIIMQDEENYINFQLLENVLA